MSGYVTRLSVLGRLGPSGSSKTILATQFWPRARVGEPGGITAFEKSPNQLLSQRRDALVESGQVGMISTRKLDLSTDDMPMT
jgi:circadian clock protein KaiC